MRLKLFNLELYEVEADSTSLDHEMSFINGYTETYRESSVFNDFVSPK